MTRQIKFRCWDKINNKMILEVMGTPYQDYVFRDDDYVVQQYTGLKDKTGKQIYEGDYLRQQTIIAEILRKEGGFYLHRLEQNGIDVSNSNLTNLSEDSMTFYEVIGNKYENPELLTT